MEPTTIIGLLGPSQKPPIVCTEQLANQVQKFSPKKEGAKLAPRIPEEVSIMRHEMKKCEMGAWKEILSSLIRSPFENFYFALKVGYIRLQRSFLPPGF